MYNINLSEKYLQEEMGTSDGTQIKYYKDNYWYKINSMGGEDEAEYLASGILKFSSLSKDDFVIYEKGQVNKRNSCRSQTFLKPSEDFYTFNRLHINVTSNPMFEETFKYKTLSKKIEYVVNFMKNATGLDITDYLRKTFSIDSIILNEDRHFNNLGVIMREDGTYRAAPIFDNGRSMFIGNFSIKDNLPISENIKRVSCKPFGFGHKRLVEYFGKGFELDKDKAIKWIEKEASDRFRNLLIYQIENY